MKIEDFDKLNSLTKYPEIKTYHKMGDKGRLQPELSLSLSPDKLYHVSEKVDGTNTRMIFIIEADHYDYFIGSREEILTARDDRIYNPALDVVSNLLDPTDAISNGLYYRNNVREGVYTFYSELYGGKLPATKQYANSKEYSFRLFDIAYLSLDTLDSMMELPRDEIARWRINGGQEFLTTDERAEFCKALRLNKVPFCENVFGREVPTDIKDTYEFLLAYKTTKAGIDREGGRAEGVVIRSDDRKEIVKLRFEDYERTLSIRRK